MKLSFKLKGAIGRDGDGQVKWAWKSFRFWDEESFNTSTVNGVGEMASHYTQRAAQLFTALRTIHDSGDSNFYPVWVEGTPVSGNLDDYTEETDVAYGWDALYFQNEAEKANYKICVHKKYDGIRFSADAGSLLAGILGDDYKVPKRKYGQMTEFHEVDGGFTAM